MGVRLELGGQPEGSRRQTVLWGSSGREGGTRLWMALNVGSLGLFWPWLEASAVAIGWGDVENEWMNEMNDWNEWGLLLMQASGFWTKFWSIGRDLFSRLRRREFQSCHLSNRSGQWQGCKQEQKRRGVGGGQRQLMCRWKWADWVISLMCKWATEDDTQTVNVRGRGDCWAAVHEGKTVLPIINI